MKEDTPGCHASGFLPNLDTQMGVVDGQPPRCKAHGILGSSPQEVHHEHGLKTGHTNSGRIRENKELQPFPTLGTKGKAHQ